MLAQETPEQVPNSEGRTNELCTNLKTYFYGNWQKKTLCIQSSRLSPRYRWLQSTTEISTEYFGLTAPESYRLVHHFRLPTLLVIDVVGNCTGPVAAFSSLAGAIRHGVA